MWQYRILGILLIYFFAITVKQDYQELIVRNEGKLVSVVIFGKHKGGGRFNNYFFDFEFADKKFDVKVSKNDYLNKNVGESINLLHVNGIDHFVMPNMAIGIDPIIGLAFLIVGIICVFYSPKKRGI